MYVGLPTVRPKLSLEISFELHAVLSPALGFRLSRTKVIYFLGNVLYCGVFGSPTLCAFETRIERHIFTEANSRIPCSVKKRSKHSWTTGINGRLCKVRFRDYFFNFFFSDSSSRSYEFKSRSNFCSLNRKRQLKLNK